jgi:hypothetical protein
MEAERNEVEYNKITVVDESNEFIASIRFRYKTNIQRILSSLIEKYDYPSFKSNEDLVFRVAYRNSIYKLSYVEVLCASGEDVMDVIIQSIIEIEDNYKRCKIYEVISIPLCIACLSEDYTQEKHICV